jgi:2-methylisocitrate lyase-like PEP mutase family enzyme
VVAAVAPRPVNVLVSAPYFTVRELEDLGVRRISVGGALARAAWGAFMRAADEIAAQGTFGRLADAAPHAELNALLASSREH